MKQHETTTGDNVFNNNKIFVISYCQLCAFHPDLNLDKTVIFGSFQQTEDEIYDLSQFSQDHVKYFDKIIFQQLKDSVKKFSKQGKNYVIIRNVFYRT